MLPSAMFRAAPSLRSIQLSRFMSTDVKKKSVVFLGTPTFAAQSLEALVNASNGEDWHITTVITQPLKVKGRLVKSPVAEVAEKHGIRSNFTLFVPSLDVDVNRVHAPESLRDPEYLEKFEAEGRPDLCITAAYGQFLPKRFLAFPHHGTLNV